MKKFFSVLLAVILCFALSGVSMAEPGELLSIQSIAINDDRTIEMQFYSAASETLQPSDLTLTLDNDELAVDTVFGHSTVGMGTSWLFLVDTSTVSTRSGDEPVKALLNGLIGGIGEKDNAAILSTGVELDGIELVENKKTLENMIDSLLKSDPAKLNATINTALDFLKKNEDVLARSCVVIISNGENIDADEAELKKLQNAVAKSGATVHTVSFARNYASKDALSCYASISAASIGGLNFQAEIKPKEEIVAGMAEQIFANEQLFRTLKTQPVPENVDGSKLTLTLNASGVQGVYTLTAGEQLNLRMSRPLPSEKPTQKPTIDPTADPTADPTVAPTDGPIPDPDPDDYLVYVLIGVGAIALCAVIIMINAVRKGRKQKDVVVPPAPIDPVGPPDEPDGPVEPEKPEKTGKIRVMLTLLDSNRDAVYTADMVSELLVGRDMTSVKLLLPSDDLKISGTHLVLRYIQGTMFVEDLSRNGTSVNGQRIQKLTKLRQHDVLTMGVSRFRITWVEE